MLLFRFVFVDFLILASLYEFWANKSARIGFY